MNHTCWFYLDLTGIYRDLISDYSCFVLLLWWVLVLLVIAVLVLLFVPKSLTSNCWCVMLVCFFSHATPNIVVTSLLNTESMKRSNCTYLCFVVQWSSTSTSDTNNQSQFTTTNPKNCTNLQCDFGECQCRLDVTSTLHCHLATQVLALLTWVLMNYCIPASSVMSEMPV